MSEETVERVTPGTESWRSYGEEHLQRYKYFSAMYRDKVVIDAACGTGYGTAYMIEQGASRAIGIDLSEEAIAYCKKHYADPRLSYQKGDAAELQQLDIKADLVVSFETIEHLRDPEKFIRNAASILNEDGKMVCSTPNKKRLSGSGNINPFHPSELEWTEFRDLFGKYFRIEHCYHQTESVPYLRYMELRHLLHQQRAQMNAFVSSRLERQLRKLVDRNFQPIPFIHEHLADLHAGDIEILPMGEAEQWHKTFIICGTVKPR